MRFEQIDYKTSSIEGNNITLPKRIRDLVLFYNKIAVRISSLKNDPEFRVDFLWGNVFVLNKDGILWQFDKKTITSI